MAKNPDKCQVKGCKRQGDHIGYYGRAVCEYHWELHCKESGRFDLKKAFRIRDERIVTSP